MFAESMMIKFCCLDSTAGISFVRLARPKFGVGVNSIGFDLACSGLAWIRLGCAGVGNRWGSGRLDWVRSRGKVYATFKYAWLTL